MRVLQVLGTSAGGTGRHVEGLVTGLLAAGHEVAVAAPAAELDRFALRDVGAHLVEIGVSTRPSPADVAAIRTLAGVAPRADVVHAHGARVGALTALALGRSAVPLVTTLHNAAPDGAAQRLVHAGLERVVARRSALVLGVSSDLVERQRELGARRVERAVIAAAPFGSVVHDRAEVRRALAVPHDAALVVCVGRLAAQKDLGVLIEATAIAADGADLLTVIAGDGPLQRELQDRIDATGAPVRLLGRRTDIADLLSAADVVASSARWEGQPVALQEALHVGAAIVATDAGGTADVVGSAALLVPTGDPAALGAALVDVIRHGTLRDDLRSKAVERAGELADSQAATQAALAAYRSVLGGAGSETSSR